ncbi:MAG: glycosyltransferase family 4 protein [Candidatus Saelkia tenebricola]|nr:glycosyltransferase family 4 protein [Candidatus Saelkia tenebricola]
MERIAFQFQACLRSEAKIFLIKWGGARKWLFLVLPWFLIKAIWILVSKKPDLVYLNDGLLSVIGVILKIFKIPVIITIHGLDITYKNKLYQWLIPRCVSKLNRVISISSATRKECLNRGVPEDKISIVPDGFRDQFYISEDKAGLRKEFTAKFDLDLKNKKILLSVSRLIERKGIHWFVDNVIPILKCSSKDFIYFVAGDGVLYEQIKKIISKKGLSNWVVLLGGVDDDLLMMLYNISDVLIMPNIPVAGDIEGFGVVALEASSCKIPVIASDLEGIKDVLLNGDMGTLVKPFDESDFKTQILNMLRDDIARKKYGEKVRNLVLDNFSWEIILKRYLNIFKAEILTFNK